MSGRKKKKIRRWRCGSTILYFVKDPSVNTYFTYEVYAGDSGALGDLDQDYLPKEKWSTSGMYSRQQVKEIAGLAGYDEEQIEAALLLADTYDTSDEHDLCIASDREYERLIANAKRRLAY